MTATLTAPLRVLGFTLWFAWQIVVSSAAVLADVLSPGLRARPLVVRMPLESRTDLQITGIGALITLTPGTLTIGVEDLGSGDRTLIVHSMYHDDTEAALADLTDMEHRMLRAFWRRP